MKGLEIGRTKCQAPCRATPNIYKKNWDQMLSPKGTIGQHWLKHWGISTVGNFFAKVHNWQGHCFS
jgi:hypothetical protein